MTFQSRQASLQFVSSLLYLPHLTKSASGFLYDGYISSDFTDEICYVQTFIFDGLDVPIYYTTKTR